MFSILTEISAQVSRLVVGGAPSITTLAWVLFNAIAVFNLVMIIIRWELDLMDSHHWTRFHFSEVVLFLMRVAAAGLLLTFYSTPLPGFGVSFHQLLPSIGQTLAATIGQSGDAAVTANLNLAVANLPAPGMLAPIEILTYLIILIVVAIFQTLLFLITAFGFLAVGVLSITGTLMIPLLLTKNFSKYFWSWLDMMVVYSMYPFLGAAFVFVLGNSLNNFFVRAFAGGYTLPQLLLSIPTLLVLLGTFSFAIFKVPQFASQHFGGAGSVSSGVADGIEMYVRGKLGS